MPQILGFELQKAVCEGRVATYVATRTGDGQDFLAKLATTENSSVRDFARLRNEFELTQNLDIGGVLKSIDLVSDSSGLLLVQEAFAGVPVGELVQKGPLKLPDFFDISIPLVRTLGELHSEGILHKGICSRAILFDSTAREVRLTDFGIAARHQYEPPVANAVIHEESITYMSPEQTGRMNRGLDHRTDIYSLGITFYEMLTGQVPFASEDPLKIVHAHLASKPNAPDIHSPRGGALSKVVMKMLAKEAQERYQSSYGLLRDLEWLADAARQEQDFTGFEPGQWDISERLQISGRMYGRDKERAALLAVFERAIDGAGGLILISGYAGIGKSSLVDEMRKPVAQHRGIFVSGKFDQFKRELPYHALIQAFKELIRQLLTEPADQVSKWRNSLIDSLGTNIQVAAEVIPELELIVGAQDKPPQLGPTETQNRFKLVFQTFVSNFARPGRPLVLFLDDLQWTDSASLNLIELLNKSTTNRHLLIIGAYREHEVDAEHPLQIALTKWHRDGMSVESLSLQSLGRPEITGLVADSLGVSADYSSELANLIYEKAEGNPFFSIELLKEFCARDLVYFDSRRRDAAGWHWDLDQISRAAVADNVVELILKKVRQLSESAQQVLMTAACIGSRFELQALSIVMQQEESKVLDILGEALEHGLLSHAKEYVESRTAIDAGATERHTFYFVHDRIQQAAYSLIPEAEVPQRHLEIGRQMLQFVASDDLEDLLFEVVNHFSAGIHLISDNSEKLQLAKLSHRAGSKARAASAYVQAARYLRIGAELLQSEDWTANYSLAFSLHLDRVECEYLIAEIDVAENAFAELLDRARSTMDRVAAYRVRISSLSHLQRLDEAIDAGLQCLSLLDIHLPKQPSTTVLLRNLLQIKLRLRGRSLDDLAGLPREMPEERRAAMSVLWDIWGPAFLEGNENLQGLIVFNMMQLSLRFGNSEQSPIGYTGYGVFLASVMKRVRDGYNFGRMSLALANEFGVPIWIGKLQFIHSAFLSHHGAPLRKTISDLEQAFETSVESGDLIYAGYCSDVIMFTLPYCGMSFDEIVDVIIRHSEFARRVENKTSIDTIAILSRWLDRLRDGASTGDDAELQADLSEMEQAWAEYLQTTASFIEGDFQSVVDSAPGLHETPITDSSSYFAVQLDFMQCISLAILSREAAAAERRGLQRQIRKIRKRLDAWATNCPDNFDFKQRLLDAELARAGGSIVEAMQGYDEAIELARRRGFLHFEALGNELAGRFHMAGGGERIARSYLVEARYLYWKWGATAKVRQLEVEFRELLEAGGRESIGVDQSLQFDLATVLKAAQAISSEIVLDQLLRQLMDILIENAGAQRGVLLLAKHGSLRIEAELELDRHGGRTVQLMQSTDIDEADNVSVGMVNLVVRTRENLVVQNASEDQRFSQDPYVRSKQPKSVLCTPLLTRGDLIGAVYLENNLSSGAFTHDRLAVVNLLSGQAAISIQNAKLYTDQVRLVDSAKRFVPVEFLQLLNKKGLEEIQLGDNVQLELTFMVTDIRSFTAISEQMTPQENFEFINDYFHNVVPQIEKHGGFVGKYTGDGLMAFFPDSVDDAVRSAINVMKQLHMYNAKRGAAGLVDIESGIGLHFGSAMLGTVGQKDRMQGDVMSDAANLTSRVEGLCRVYGAPVLMSDAAFSRLRDPDAYEHRCLGKVLVKGREETVQVFEICDGDQGKLAALKIESKHVFEEALSLFYERRFAEASVSFEKVIKGNATDRAAQLYLQRCAYFMVNHPPPDWAGVESASE